MSTLVDLHVFREKSTESERALDTSSPLVEYSARSMHSWTRAAGRTQREGGGGVSRPRPSLMGVWGRGWKHCSSGTGGTSIVVAQHHPRPISRFIVPLLTCAVKMVLARIVASPNMPYPPVLLVKLDGSSS